MCATQQVPPDGCPEPCQVANLLQQVLSGDLAPRYGAKGGKGGGDPPAEAGRRKSVDLSQNPPFASNRKSVDLTQNPPFAGNRKSVDLTQNPPFASGRKSVDLTQNPPIVSGRRASINLQSSSTEGGSVDLSAGQEIPAATTRRSVVGGLSSGLGAMSVDSSANVGAAAWGVHGPRKSVSEFGPMEMSQNTRRSMDGYSPINR
jgi:hypothetical protein